MDLTIKDVAELLSVSEHAIRRLLSEGQIPAYWINHQYRFSRVEIEDWLMKQGGKKIQGDYPILEEKKIEEKKKPAKKGSRQFSLYRALNHGDILINIPGDTKEAVIRNAMKKIASSLNLDEEGLSELFLERERLHPTALNRGIGIPHARDFLLDSYKDVVVVVFPEKPIEYGALDGRPVHTLFFLFACEDKKHLQLLAKIAHLVSFDRTQEFLLKKPEKMEFLAYVREWESSTHKDKNT